MMYTNSSNVAFTSVYRPALLTEFTKASEPLYRSAFVKHPWTAKESIISKDAFTMDVFDCSAGGIIDSKNKRVFLFHLCPEMKENQFIPAIEEHISSAFEDVKEGLRAFITGSNKMYKDSINMYQHIKSSILRRDIPLTEFKGPASKSHILYNSSRDEWLISSIDINTKLRNGVKPEDLLRECFDEVIVDNGDSIAAI